MINCCARFPLTGKDRINHGLSDYSRPDWLVFPKKDTGYNFRQDQQELFSFPLF